MIVVVIPSVRVRWQPVYLVSYCINKTTNHKKRVVFIAFMEELLAELLQGEDIEFHVILDNYCIHKKNDEWLSAHNNVFFHFTPTSASWLNQVEIWINSLLLRNRNPNHWLRIVSGFDDFTMGAWSAVRKAIQRFCCFAACRFCICMHFTICRFRQLTGIFTLLKKPPFSKGWLFISRCKVVAERQDPIFY